MAAALTPADAFARLAAARVEYSPADQCFVVPSATPGERPERKRGLTKILRSLMPVPHGEPDPSEPAPKRARRSKNDPVVEPRVWRQAAAGAQARRFIARAAPSCRDAVAGCQLEGRAAGVGRSGIGSAYNMLHGSLVDEQIKLRIQHGRAALDDRTHGAMRGGLDPCAATLFDWADAHGRRFVAAQVPLLSAEMNVATAFDVMGDRGELYEIKSTTATTPDAVERGDRSYELARARLTRTALRGTPCSQYSLGQVQLYVTRAMVAEMSGFEPPAAAVLRVSPGVVREYELNPWFKTRADRFRRAIAQSTGQHKRNLRVKRHVKVLAKQAKPSKKTKRSDEPGQVPASAPAKPSNEPGGKASKKARRAERSNEPGGNPGKKARRAE